jgi:hypothetical protein
MRKARCLFVVIVLLTAARVALANNVYVDASAAGANNGTSWDNAYTSLQAAIDTGAVVHVAAGTYKPAGPGGDAAISFVMEPFVTIEGGWSKVESVWIRDPAATPTILSGDLNGNDTLYDLTFDWPNHKFDLKNNAGGTRSDNTKIVVNCNDKYSMTLDGITIRSGNNTGGSGGGIVGNAATTLTIKNCIIDNNYCNSYGGGIFISQGSTSSTLTIMDSQIINNTCKNNWGGGIRVDNGCYFTMANTTVKGNVSWDDGAGGVFVGAAICTISDCLFQKNWSWDGAGLVCRTNGVSYGNIAMKLPAVAYTLNNTIFDTNRTKWSCSGAMFEMDSDNFTPPYDTNSRMIVNLTNCLIKNGYQETRSNGAVGIASTNRNPSLDVMTANFKNCTIVNNDSIEITNRFKMNGICYTSYLRGDNGGGQTVNIDNSILWNPGIELGPCPDDPAIPWNNGFVKTTTRYNCIERTLEEEPNSCFGIEIGNISANPQFVGGDPDYNVQPTSPTIDAGDPASDYSKENRCNGGRVNMGWTGNTSKATPALTADIDCDNMVNIVDFSEMANQWLDTAPEPLPHLFP